MTIEFTREGWQRERAAREKGDRARTPPPDLRKIEMAAVSQRQLEGRADEWRPFFQYLQAARDEQERKRLECHEWLETDESLQTDRLLLIKYEMARAIAARDILDWAMSIPKQLADAGADAKERLSEAN
jgi:hypothetical protein